MIGKVGCFCVGVCFCCLAFALELDLQITDLEGKRITQVVQGESFLVQVRVVGDQQGLGEPAITYLQKLSHYQRYPVSTHITIKNGQQYIERSYAYKARIDACGQFALGPAYFDLGGRVIQSNALSFMVVKGQAGAVAAVNVTDPFIHVKVNKTSAYVKEQVLVQVRLCYKQPVTTFVLEPWGITNGVRAQLGNPVQETFSYDGHSWSCFLYTFALYPQQAGELVIPGLQAHGEREKESTHNSFFSQFFFGNNREKISVQSKPVVVTINPLPAHVLAGQIVGEFTSFSAQFDKKELEPGTAATLTITLVGNGDMNHITFDKLVLPAALKTYESKTTFELDQQRPGFIVRRQEIIVQALEAGVFSIAAQTFIFFNPATRTITQLKTGPLTLTAKKGITKNRGPQDSVVRAAEKQRRSWPAIPRFWMILLSTGLLLYVVGMYLVVHFQEVIDKKITYFICKRQVKKAHRAKDVQAVHKAWFTLLSQRLGVNKMVHSLYDVGDLFDHDQKERWRYYVAQLELRAFQSRETIFDINDLIMQTYDWLDELEAVL